jgi:hypothetical protein
MNSQTANKKGQSGFASTGAGSPRVSFCGAQNGICVKKTLGLIITASRPFVQNRGQLSRNQVMKPTGLVVLIGILVGSESEGWVSLSAV